MLAGLLTLVAAASFGQMDGAAYYGFTEERKTRETTKFILKNGQEFHAFVDEERPDKFFVREDLFPWGAGRWVFKSALEGWETERPKDRYARVKKWFEDLGYVEIADWKFYPKQEVDWARKAREMAGIDKPEEPAQPLEPPKPAPQPVPAAPPGFFVQWGGHGALLVVSLLLILLTYRTLIAVE